MFLTCCVVLVLIFNFGQQFEQEVPNSANPVFVGFWAEWCVVHVGPYRLLSRRLSAKYDGKVNFVKINVDENGELAQKYNVFSIPTLAIFKNGEIVSQKVGAFTKESFQTMMDSSLN